MSKRVTVKLKIVECVPNFSEGRDKEVIDSIGDAIKSVEGVRLLDVEFDPDHNRSVFTFIGTPENVKEAAHQAADVAVENIDMRKHQGGHPRMGAVDVVPFIPLHGTTIGECIELSKEFGKEFAAKHDVPVYLYAESATKPEREELPNIRQGEYELLSEKIGEDPVKEPDFGPNKINPKAGATATGARHYLIAFNMNLDTTDVEVAKECANAVRATTGGFVYVQGIGLDLPEKGMVQVSCNLIHPKRTKIHQVLEVVKNEARRFGATVVETEIIGMVPLFALLDALDYYLQPERLDEDMILDLYYLGGTDDPTEKSFSEMSLIEFSDAVRRARATPGGGSVAAAMGAFGSALVCMVTGLSLTGRKFAAIKQEMLDVRHDTETDRGELMGLVEEDSEAFDQVMAKYKMKAETEEEKQEKQKQIQEATKNAAEVPLETMRRSYNALENAVPAAKKGNINAVTDAGVAAHALMAAIEGAALNVRINLDSIEDESYVKKTRKEVEELIEKGKETKAEVLELVEKRMKEMAEQ